MVAASWNALDNPQTSASAAASVYKAVEPTVGLVEKPAHSMNLATKGNASVSKVSHDVGTPASTCKPHVNTVEAVEQPAPTAKSAAKGLASFLAPKKHLQTATAGASTHKQTPVIVEPVTVAANRVSCANVEYAFAPKTA